MKYNCDVFKNCGSCQYMGIDYNKQLEKKTEYVKKLVKEAKMNNIKVADCHPSKNIIGYRNKVIVAFDNNYNYGLYEEGSHRIVPYKRCLIHDEISDEIIRYLQTQFKKFRVSIYDAKRRKGLLRHVLIRRGVATNETMVVLVCNGDEFKGSKNLSKVLVKKFPSIKTVVLNVNKRDTSIVLGNKDKILYGTGFIIDKLCGLSFKISPQSFYQINHDQTEELYEFGLGLVKLDRKTVLMDTYSGIGTIGMVGAKDVKEVISVEMNKEAHRDAINNARANKINNIRFINEDATKFMVDQAKTNLKVDVIIMDPPRAGSTKEFIHAAGKMEPREILYISCDPKTQVRDLKEFEKIGYKTETIYPFDMFPQTTHVEAVCRLTRTGTKRT